MNLKEGFTVSTEDIMENDSFYLRPAFTKRVIRDLIDRGFSINIFGQPGTGRTRLLEDIQHSDLKNVRSIYVNMKNCKESYNGFINIIWEQFGKKGQQPSAFGDIIKAIDETEEKIMLLIDNFDSILNNPQIDNSLNSIKNKTKISLLCVTEKPHDHSVIHFNGKPHGTSWLDLNKVELPKLTYREIDLELSRHVSMSLTSDEKVFIANVIYKYSEPYNLMTFFIEKISNNADYELNINLRVKKWKKNYRERKNVLSTSNLHKFMKYMKNLTIVTGLDKLADPFISLFKIIKTLISKF